MILIINVSYKFIIKISKTRHSEESSKTNNGYDFDNKVDLKEFDEKYTLERPLEKLQRQNRDHESTINAVSYGGFLMFLGFKKKENYVNRERTSLN